ncbi:unnamed protein product [Lactuca saligna]|uniref:Uncharacterized protein n=1 Tax=Lactuca saligna TaxID=75948 RepID=A0AA36E1B2_LACSI|nr:unnamed protein product [Lactuca saligna]
MFLRFWWFSREWVLPNRHSEGTKVYNNEALRTPFVKAEIDDPAIEAIQFLIVDERRNRWYKDNDQNFYLKLPLREKPVSNVEVPEDLVQIQAYLRWERNGKQTYTLEQEKKEFEEARKELQRELEKGSYVDDIRNKTTKGDVQKKVQKQQEKKIYFTPVRINRKKRDLTQLLKKPTPTYRLYDKEFLVLVTKASGKTRVHLATDMEGPLILHWALSERTREWLKPPVNLLPEGSTSLEKAAETQFSTISIDDPSNKIQTLGLEIDEDSDSDFYVDFTGPKKAIKDVGDGKGTTKDLLEKIASLESEAEKSFMHSILQQVRWKKPRMLMMLRAFFFSSCPVMVSVWINCCIHK